MAANLAVRWHPHGHRLLHVQEIAGGPHALFVFDLASRKSERLFPHSSAALLFDFAPDNKHLVCVLGSANKPQNNDGIWIGRPEQDEWWHVPGTQQLAQGELPSLIERLRATRPAWTPDAKQFAFVSSRPPVTDQERPAYFVHLGDLATRKLELLAHGKTPFRDLCWAASGEQLGLVRDGQEPALLLLRPGVEPGPPVNSRPVRQFVGWSVGGKHLAYIVPDRIPLTEGPGWAFLLLPDRKARDAVFLADGAGNEPGHEVFSGMRVTFPQWSPRDEQLSLWVTFAPTHRSWVSQFIGRSLQPGDPAALLDPKTGKLSWLAVNAHEKAQIGHYHLLKRDYAEAWRWYSAAEREQSPAVAAPSPRQTLAMLQDLDGRGDSTFFQYYCLTKLGRDDEARAMLERYTKTFLPATTTANNRNPGEQILQGMLREVLAPDGVFAPLFRDLYAAEVFLSLDAVEDGESYFRGRLAATRGERERLSAALVLGQLLLLQGKHAEYLELASASVAPLLLRIHLKQPHARAESLLNPQTLLDMVGDVALLPACAPEFLKSVPTDTVAAAHSRWQKLRLEATRDVHRRCFDRLLTAAQVRLGQKQLSNEEASRLRQEVDALRDVSRILP
ncbi:MAG: hypothetical protein AB7K24_06845 [Gemmataceae bacterium]